ncbi:MAG TPA: tetratricopeptide repeat protein [Rhodanobacteraceae bacterium]|nr:tetratricopeptide repeat protein [Rhodanobacteraceae bacterium]
MTPVAHSSPRWLTSAILLTLPAIVLLVAWWAYHPGLGGGFLFDDFANLPALGATGPVDNWATFWRYITSGHADPTGRPLTLLTFLIDARNWPADPRPFLRTSIVLHLVNGALLFLLLRRLGRALKPGPTDGSTDWRINLAALLGAALWLLHPLFVSTTLYIVQREAMLPATFVLAGLMLWLHGRTRMLAGRTVSGWVWMLLGLGGCTLLAVLSKANGILLPALALTIEYTVLRHPAPVGAHPVRDGLEVLSGPRPSRTGCAPTRETNRYRVALCFLGWLPACVVASYLIHAGWNGFVHGISSARPWTLGQRLLTEPRVLMDYLQLLWLPRPFTPGLFNDQIHASTLLFAPWTTLPCLLAVFGLIVGALWLRKRWPALALAVLFYFVGQALESSTIALELYFEHRNYLPAMLMFWPLALWLCGVPQSRRVGPGPPWSIRWTSAHPAKSKPVDWKWIKALLAVLILAGLAVMTHARANVWGNTREQALLWAKLNPDSPRAQTNAAQAELHAGHPRLAARHLRDLLRQRPQQVQLAFNLFAAECGMGHVSPSTIEAAKTALATTRNPGALLAHWFGRAIAQTAHPPCPQMTLDTLEQLLTATRSNPKMMAIRGRRQDIAYMQGRMALKRGQPDQALADFKYALDQDVRTSAALEQAAQLGMHGYPRRGLAMLHYYETQAQKHLATPGFGMPRVHAWVLKRERYWPHELERLRQTLRQDLAAKRNRK